jgi:diaminopimelate epimerase
MDIPFTKAHGTGNDFIILLKDDIKNIELDEELIQKLCYRRTGIGADGLIVLSDDDVLDYKMDYYNNDGTWETMCANGARCTAVYMHRRGFIKKTASFSAGDGPHDVELLKNNIVRLRMGSPHYESGEVEVAGFRGRHVDSGARHFAVYTDNLLNVNVSVDGRNIRNSDIFAPRGINVNFFSQLDNNSIQVETYEKGIEQMMLSCGSGSVAAAYHASKMFAMFSPIHVAVPGGNLIVEFDPDWKEVWLSGSAILLFVSNIHVDDINSLDNVRAF